MDPLPQLRETYTEEDFLENLDTVISEDPSASYRIIADNLNMHASELVDRYVAESCQLPDELVVKGRWWVLKDLPSQRTFLTAPAHRIRSIFTPKRCSWLNQIEIWFGILRRKVIRNGSFPSIESLCSQISRFMDCYNQTMAKPFQWNYAGRCAIMPHRTA